jgi:cyclophilin family peptidyl-prolyl cis-trans isomerase
LRLFGKPENLSGALPMNVLERNRSSNSGESGRKVCAGSRRFCFGGIAQLITEKLYSKISFAFVLVCCLLFFAACGNQQGGQSNQNTNPSSPTTGQSPTQSGKPHVAVLETSEGTIRFELLEGEAPKTSENFIKLAEKGFYNGLIFHRVITNFMIQGGDPKGDGTGGQTADGKDLPNEMNRSSPIYQRGGYLRGYVAMANKGFPQSATSQFFIMHQDRPFSNLPPNYVVFGRVISGIEVVDKIASVPTSPPSNRPTSPVVMKKVTIEEKKG